MSVLPEFDGLLAVAGPPRALLVQHMPKVPPTVCPPSCPDTECCALSAEQTVARGNLARLAAAVCTRHSGENAKTRALQQVVQHMFAAERTERRGRPRKETLSAGSRAVYTKWHKKYAEYLKGGEDTPAKKELWLRSLPLKYRHAARSVVQRDERIQHPRLDPDTVPALLACKCADPSPNTHAAVFRGVASPDEDFGLEPRDITKIVHAAFSSHFRIPNSNHFVRCFEECVNF